MSLARHSRNRMPNIEASAESGGPINSSAGLVSERENADSGAGCPRTPAGRRRTAARARVICRGRNPLFLSPSRRFRPRRPPLPGQGTPPVGGWGSRISRKDRAAWSKGTRCSSRVRTRRKTSDLKMYCRCAEIGDGTSELISYLRSSAFICGKISSPRRGASAVRILAEGDLCG
jgi:hypothetical protein